MDTKTKCLFKNIGHRAGTLIITSLVKRGVSGQWSNQNSKQNVAYLIYNKQKPENKNKQTNKHGQGQEG